MKKSLICIFIVAACVSCSTPIGTFNKVPLGASKAFVVNELGSPRRSFRKEGIDHWLYVFPGEDGQRIEREIRFKDGNVISRDGLNKPKDSDFVPVD